MYRIVDGYGKKGIEIWEGKRIIKFYSHLELSINNKEVIPDDLDKNSIPDFEKNEHYRVSQVYYYNEKRKKIAQELRKNPEEIDVSPEMSFKWEAEFRLKYYLQHVKDKIKV